MLNAHCISYHQNFTRYDVHLVRPHNFFRKQLFIALLQNHNKQQIESLCKTLVLVTYDRKTLYFRKIVRNVDITPFKKSEKAARK